MDWVNKTVLEPCPQEEKSCTISTHIFVESRGSVNRAVPFKLRREGWQREKWREGVLAEGGICTGKRRGWREDGLYPGSTVGGSARALLVALY